MISHLIFISTLDPNILIQTRAYIAFIPFSYIPGFHFTPITEDDVMKAIMAIKSKTVGCDDISGFMIINIIDFCFLQ